MIITCKACKHWRWCMERSRMIPCTAFKRKSEVDMKLIKLSSVGMVMTYDYPEGSWKEKQRVLTGLIGPECELLETVQPQKLYKPFGGPMELGKVTMLVDESGWFHNTIPNIRASQLYGDTIMGTALFVGVDGEDFTGLTDDQVKELTAYL